MKRPCACLWSDSPGVAWMRDCSGRPVPRLELRVRDRRPRSAGGRMLLDLGARARRDRHEERDAARPAVSPRSANGTRDLEHGRRRPPTRRPGHARRQSPVPPAGGPRTRRRRRPTPSAHRRTGRRPASRNFSESSTPVGQQVRASAGCRPPGRNRRSRSNPNSHQRRRPAAGGRSGASRRPTSRTSSAPAPSHSK